MTTEPQPIYLPYIEVTSQGDIKQNEGLPSAVYITKQQSSVHNEYKIIEQHTVTNYIPVILPELLPFNTDGLQVDALKSTSPNLTSLHATTDSVTPISSTLYIIDNTTNPVSSIEAPLNNTYMPAAPILDTKTDITTNTIPNTIPAMTDTIPTSISVSAPTPSSELTSSTPIPPPTSYIPPPSPELAPISISISPPSPKIASSNPPSPKLVSILTAPKITSSPSLQRKPMPLRVSVLLPPEVIQTSDILLESTGSTFSDLPERQPATPRTISAKRGRRFSSILEPPMPVEHKKDRLRHFKLHHKKNTLGETIYKGHPSWLLMRDIQTGLYNNIRNMAQRTQDMDLYLTPAVTVLPMSPDAKSTFKFKDYCPMAFYNLREHFGINHVDYVTSLCQNWNEVGTPGKSGSLFFFSLDNQYVLKTIPKREAKILRNLLPAYYSHMRTHSNSLLTRFMGLHRVKPHRGRQVRFLVMGNLFNSNLRVHMRFDLKGSTVGRELSPLERGKKNPTFKDLDFRRINRKLHLGPNRDVMLKQIKLDTDFLSSQYIMDYSLLVGIHFNAQKDGDEEDEEETEEEWLRSPPLNRSMSHLPPYVADTEVHPPNQALSIFEREEGGIRARDPAGNLLEEYYYIGVIDILMHYSTRKQLEHVGKRIMHPRGEISSVEPYTFAQRFVKFAVESIV